MEGERDEGEEHMVEDEIEDRFRGGEEWHTSVGKEQAVETAENYENKREEPITGGGEGNPDEEQDAALCGMGCDIWDGFEDIVCEVIEDEESRIAERKDAGEGVAGERDMIGDEVKVGEEEEQIAMVDVLGDETKVSEVGMMREEEAGVIIKTDVKTEVVEELMETVFIEEEHKDPVTQQHLEKQEIHLQKIRELDDGNKEGGKENQEERALKEEEMTSVQQHNGEGGTSKEQEQQKNVDTERAKERTQTPPSVEEKEKGLKEVKCEESDGSRGSEAGVGSKLVISKVYQVKSVPVVPPKPQHCRLTALSLRQQRQPGERSSTDRERENMLRVDTGNKKDKESDKEAKGENAYWGEHRKKGEGEDEGKGRREKQALRGRKRERRRDGDDGGMGEVTRNSPHSMCFDEAVAIATMRREREKESRMERDRQKDWGYEVQ